MEPEYHLDKAGKADELSEVVGIAELRTSTTCARASRSGSATRSRSPQARGRQPVPVLLGDEFMAKDSTLLADMIKIHTQYGRSVSRPEVEEADIKRYGNVKPERISDHLVQILDLAGSPTPPSLRRTSR
ncbi:MAG: hypothetical protein R2701_04230 [Acidimicrobiales bacterium]